MVVRKELTTLLLVLLAGFVPLVGCGDDRAGDDANGPAGSAGSGFDVELARQVVENYADGVYASYEAALTSAKAMAGAINAFLAAPSNETLEAARQAWTDARDEYGRTEAYRFYGGPIDNDDDGPEALLNGWPLDEAYIDRVEGGAGPGIIGDTENFPEITEAALVAANEQGGEANLSTGWHAIEFLLWGQDRSVDGPGNRPVSDYITDPNADRRSAYLNVVTELLVKHLESLVAAWAPEGDNYRARFIGQDAATSLVNMVTGIGELSRGELAGERMNVAYEERDQENEHSCFSDTTTADLIANAEGILEVWTGRYAAGPRGPGLEALVARADREKARRVTESMEASLTRLREIPAPFDQHLTDDAPDDGPGRTAIRDSIRLLSEQTDALVIAAKAIGLSVEVS
jgi:putative iron-regulated protein